MFSGEGCTLFENLGAERHVRDGSRGGNVTKSGASLSPLAPAFRSPPGAAFFLSQDSERKASCPHPLCQIPAKQDLGMRKRPKAAAPSCRLSPRALSRTAGRLPSATLLLALCPNRAPSQSPAPNSSMSGGPGQGKGPVLSAWGSGPYSSAKPQEDEGGHSGSEECGPWHETSPAGGRDGLGVLHH